MKTIRTYNNVAEAGFASSLLESAGFRTLLAGQESFLTVPGPATGGIQLQVEDDQVENALRILDEGLDAAEPIGDGSASTEAVAENRAGIEEGEKGPLPVGLFVAAGVVLAVLCFAVYQVTQEYRTDHKAQGREILRYDFDHDGRPDHFYTYDHGVASHAEVDRNGDGRMDVWEWFDAEGRPERAEEDQNFDGRPDGWIVYRNGQIESERRDSDFDGRPDWFNTWKHGSAVRADCRPGDSQVVVRRLVFENGVATVEYVDEDEDGTFDSKYQLNPFGARSEKRPLAPNDRVMLEREANR